MSAQGKRDAAVVFVPLGACRRQKIVQGARKIVEWARSTVNQEGTCGTKGRKGMQAGACEPFLGREGHSCTQALFQSATAQLDALRFRYMRRRLLQPHRG